MTTGDGEPSGLQGLPERDIAEIRALADRAVVKARQVADLMQQLSDRLGRTDDTQ